MKKNKKVRIGTVISDKMDKTVSVRLQRRTAHSLYSKVVTSYSKVKAHDEKNTAKAGDKVRIVETRPLSKTKRWRVVEVIK